MATPPQFGTPASAVTYPHQQDIHAYLTTRVFSRRAEYLRQKRVRVKVASWNVAAVEGTEKDLEEWFVDHRQDLGGDDEGRVGVYVLALQEVVDVAATENFIKYIDPKVALSWEAHAQAAVPAGYTCLASRQLIGLLLMVFVSPELSPFVTSISTAAVGTGVGVRATGFMGNKGAVGVRMVIGETLKLVLVNCHLAASTHNTERRNWDAAEILRRMSFDGVARDFVGLDEAETVDGAGAGSEGIESADVLLWCGDFNYRIELPNEDIRRLLSCYMPKDLPPTHADGPPTPATPVDKGPRELEEPPLPPPPSEIHPEASHTLQGTIGSLLDHDQLYKQQEEAKAFVGFKEGRITFLPSYKYEIGTVGTWDASEKARAPSWCDRILWKAKGASDQEAKRGRTRSRGMSILKDEVLFETGDSDEEDIVVSRAESTIPRLPLAGQFKTSTASTFRSTSGEVGLRQLFYTSCQNITSSDHKPVLSMFELWFPAVVSEMKAKVYTEVAREVDKLENERRPVVTVVADQVDDGEHEEGIVDFGEVRYAQTKRRSVTVANTGTGEARIKFVGRPSLEGDGANKVIAKEWLKVGFVWGGTEISGHGEMELQPGDACSVLLTILVDKPEHVRSLNEGKEAIVDVLVLRVVDGRDVFLPIGGEWIRSGFGRGLKELVRIPEGVGGIRGWEGSEEGQGEILYSAPRELYKMTEFLLQNLREMVKKDGRWSSEPGWPFLESTWAVAQDRRRGITVGVWECVDTDLELDGGDEALTLFLAETDEAPIQKVEVVEVVAGVLLLWLQNLEEGVLPKEIWPNVFKAGGDRKLAEEVLDKLFTTFSSIHANVFVYLTGFIMEVISLLSLSPPLPPPSPVKDTDSITSPKSPIGGVLPFSMLRAPRDMVVKRGILDVFAGVIIRKEGGKKTTDEKRRSIGFLNVFVADA